MGKKEKTEKSEELEIKEVDECGAEDSKEDELNKKISELQESVDNYKDLYQRLMAEFDNYKKRTIKERDIIKEDAKIEIIAKFLPVIDNIERAEKSFETEASALSLKNGIDMVYKQIADIMESEEVTYIEALGVEFDPKLHNAVMHIEDEKCDDNVIVEEFQKGYKCKDKVIRYSMVKVAN